MSRYLDPRSDIVFKKIFAEHPHLLISFLNAVLPLPSDGPIKTIEYLYPEQAPQIPIFKRPVVDVKCTDNQGRIFVVEMQMEWMAGFMQRMLFNSSQAYIKQLVRGEDYRSLCPVYGLGIVNAVFDASESWYHHYQIVHVEQPKKQLKGLEFVFLELPKFKPSTWGEKKLAVLWLRFLSEIPDRATEVPAELLEVPEIREACALSEESAYSEAELDLYHQYWDSVSREKTLMSGSKEEGLTEGLVKGKAEGLAEGAIKLKAEKEMIAKNLLALGLEHQKIAEATRLSIQEIEKLI